MKHEPNRREFVGTLASLGIGATLGARILQETRAEAGGIPTRPLGNTGERVSIICLGGWHIGATENDQEAIKIMHAAIENGLTFFDNAWDYHNGGSEKIMGKALALEGKRKKVFLMTKNCERDYEGSKRNLDESLKRLQTDYIDLWQFHEMIYDNDPDWVFDKGGLKAALEAQKAGKVRYIGFTGHKDPRIHLKMLAKPHHWDASQMPINVLDAHYRSFQKQVLPVCLEKETGVIGMKALGGGGGEAVIPSKLGISASECRRYALSLPISSLVAGISTMEHLEQDLAVARDFKPMTEPEIKALQQRFKEVASDGRFELFKSTQGFDGSHHRRQHGFST
jgi:predicted aldo/keto reductase-like oxidoreductase